MIDSETQLTNFKEIYKVYREIFQRDVSDYENETFRLVLPILPIPILISLCDSATKVFQDEPILLIVNVDVVVVGDLHGHILDLFRILKTQGLPDKMKYVFLGDLVDRGEFSVETITLVYLLKVLWPSNVLIIRGNHEFNFLAYNGGFMGSVMEEYGDMGIYMAFMKSFSYIPLALRIDGVMLCVHGGIGPSIFSIKQIMQLQRPIDDFGNETLDSLLWSDPSEEVNQFVASTRGTGYFFGEDIIMNFFELNNLELMVRGHEMVQNGVDVIHGGRVVTVFSASYYCGISSNRAGVLVLKANGDKDVTTFPPLNYFKRPLAHFKNINIIPLGPLRPIKNFDLASSSSRDSGSLPSLVCPNDKAQSNEYLEQLARERLNMIKKGETSVEQQKKADSNSQN